MKTLANFQLELVNEFSTFKCSAIIIFFFSISLNYQLLLLTILLYSTVVKKTVFQFKFTVGKIKFFLTEFKFFFGAKKKKKN